VTEEEMPECLAKRTSDKQVGDGLVNTKKWYRRKADLWAELGDKNNSAGKKCPQRNR
jgi:hypothetical protein